MKNRKSGARTAIFSVVVLSLAACGSPADQAEVDGSRDPANSSAATPSEVTGSNDASTLSAAQTCHDKVWLEDERFSELPNAAVSINPTTLDDNDPTIGWIVEWDNPQVSASGTCLVEGDNVTVVDD